MTKSREPKKSGSDTPRGKLADEAADIKADLAEEAAALKDEATEQVRSFAETQKARVAETVGSIAQAARGAAKELDGKQQGDVAQLMNEVAQRLDSFSGAVADRDVGELLSKTRQFARQQPAAFLGGSVLLGLALARFVKSSADRDDTASATPEGPGSTKTRLTEEPVA